MKFHQIKISIALVLVLTICTACPFGGSNARKTIATATDDFAEAQISTANLLANAGPNGSKLITQEDINEIKPFLLQANDLNAKAIEYGKNLSKNPNDTEVKDKLITTLNQISSALVRANNAGFLRIKDPNLRTAFSALIIVMQNAATSIIILVRR